MSSRERMPAPDPQGYSGLTQSLSRAATPAPERSAESTEQSPALRIRGLSKSFAGVTVLQDVDLDIGAGRVHGLLGHNGSGKSTLIKALAGYHAPDAAVTGETFGHEFAVGDKGAAARAGLRFVHQDLGLVDQLSTVDNLALGAGYPRRQGAIIKWRAAAGRSHAAMTALGYHVNVEAPVGSLTAAERTGVAIARALQSWTGSPGVVVLDEPTASMPAPEVERLFEAVNRLRDRGLGILYVTHHIDEVLEHADDVTVLRNGQVVMSQTATGLTHDDLVKAIVGRELAAPKTRRATREPTGPPALTVEGLTTRNIHDLTFSVGAGEIVGIAGIAGSGREEVLPAVAGATPRTGVVRIANQVVAGNRPRASIRAGLGLVPADRRRSAVLSNFDVAGNLTVSDVNRYAKLGLLRRHAEVKDACAWMTDLEVVTPGVRAPILTLSGGNQQKIIVGRWLRREPSILALDEPTQGVDIGARQTIYGALRDAADAGRGVLVSSSDGDELAAICQRVLVLARGRIVAEVSGDDLTGHQLDVLSLYHGKAMA